MIEVAARPGIFCCAPLFDLRIITILEPTIVIRYLYAMIFVGHWMPGVSGGAGGNGACPKATRLDKVITRNIRMSLFMENSVTLRPGLTRDISTLERDIKQGVA